MGQDNTHSCVCCNNDNEEMNMDDTEKSQNDNDNDNDDEEVSRSNSDNNDTLKQQHSKMNANVVPEPATLKNLKSYVTFKNLDNSNSNICDNNNKCNSNISGICAEDNNNNNDTENILGTKRNSNILVYRPIQKTKQFTFKQPTNNTVESERINNIQDNIDSITNEFFRKKSNTQNPFAKIKNSLNKYDPKSRITTRQTYSKYKKNIPKITTIQSYYRKYFFNKNIYPQLKQQLQTHLNNMIKELYTKYLTNNLKQAETAIGIQHNEHSYKSLYSNGLSVGIGSAFVGGLRLFTKLLVLTYNKLPSFYVGEVSIDNALHGKGILMQCDGTKYNGTFEHGAFTGVGQLINNKGVLYEGYFTKGKLDGRATKKTLNNCLYIGDFINGVIEGNGKEECKEYIYEGEFMNDKKHGNGKIVYKQTGDVYEGEFKDDAITGDGVYKWANGESYKGSVLNGKMHGRGMYKWPDGGEYEGDYVHNLKEGKGRFRWANGKVFKGEFRNGKPNGKGVLMTNNKEYNVVFKNGKLHGKVSSTITTLQGSGSGSEDEGNVGEEEEGSESGKGGNRNSKSRNKKRNFVMNKKQHQQQQGNNKLVKRNNSGEEEDEFPIKRSKGHMINVGECDDSKGNTKYIKSNNDVIKEHNNESYESSIGNNCDKRYVDKEEKIFHFSNSEDVNESNTDSLQRNTTQEHVKNKEHNNTNNTKQKLKYTKHKH